MKRILLVEDDENLGFMLKEFLDMRGYETILRKNGLDGRDEFGKGKFDIGILDVMMPKKDGFWLGTVLKAMNPYFPIIYLTAKNSRNDAIKGFEIGADDYVTKPFSMEELLLRIKAILRRTDTVSGQEKKSENRVLNIGQFKFNPIERSLWGKKGNQKLTSKESQLLQLLIENKNSLLERTLVLNSIWEGDTYFTARSMDVYISKLRKMISEDNSLEILNVHGMGFQLTEKNPKK